MINRVGYSNALRLAGISDGALRDIRSGKTARVQKDTARRILSCLRELRKQGTIYHRLDIAAGIQTKTKLRMVKRPSHQYGPVYPELEAEFRAREAEYKRKSRAYQKQREDELERLSGY
jgi:hypothetical protein